MGTPVLPLQVINQEHDHDILDLPPGFRFHPTDEEIITCYLQEKVMDKRFTAIAVAEVDLNKSEPWDLPAKAKMGEKEWYFFCQRDRKYPTGMRTNRATESGYWKATGKDKEIYKGKGCLVGMKKTLVFYKGRAPKGEKTNWVMHEYRLEGKLSYNCFQKAAMEEWVICRVFNKTIGVRRSPLLLDSFVEDLLDSPSLPSLMEMPLSSSCHDDKPCTSSYRDELNNNTSSDEIHSSAYFSTGFFNNNYYYKQDQLLLRPKQEEAEKSYGHFVPTHHIFTGMDTYDQHNHHLASSSSNDQTLFRPNEKFSEFRTIPNYSLACDGTTFERQQLSSNNSLISRSQDTGLSTDVANEISSVIPEQGFDDSSKYFEDIDPCSSTAAPHLDSIWNY